MKYSNNNGFVGTETSTTEGRERNTPQVHIRNSFFSFIFQFIGFFTFHIRCIRLQADGRWYSRCSWQLYWSSNSFCKVLCLRLLCEALTDCINDRPMVGDSAREILGPMGWKNFSRRIVVTKFVDGLDSEVSTSNSNPVELLLPIIECLTVWLKSPTIG